MVSQTATMSELTKLMERREELRYKLKDHFCLPAVKRNYSEFESVVRELDNLRKKIHALVLIKK